MIKILLAVLLLGSSAFAQHSIQLKVDGVQYYCSQDPNNSLNANCENGLKIMKQKFDNCYKSSPGSTCLDLILPNVKKHENCADVLEYCYSTCYRFLPGSTCTDKCYN